MEHFRLGRPVTFGLAMFFPLRKFVVALSKIRLALCAFPADEAEFVGCEPL
jgi:hypothetical protein